MKKNNTPNNIGSTGTERDNPTPSKFMDKGVRKAIKNKTLSNENRYNMSTPNRIGNANIRYILFSMVK